MSLARIVFAALLFVPAFASAQSRDAATADAAPSPAERARRAEIVAHAGSRDITVGELEDMLNQAPQPVRATYVLPARRREFLENMVQMSLLADEARRRGIDRQPDASSAIRRILAQRLEQTAVI